MTWPIWGVDPWAVAILEVCQREDWPHSHWNPENGAEIVHTRFTEIQITGDGMVFGPGDVFFFKEDE